MCVCMYIYIYIYTYVSTSRASARPFRPRAAAESDRNFSVEICQGRAVREGTENILFLVGVGVPQGSPQGQTLGALLLRGTSALH